MCMVRTYCESPYLLQNNNMSLINTQYKTDWIAKKKRKK